MLVFCHAREYTEDPSRLLSFLVTYESDHDSVADACHAGYHTGGLRR